MSFLQEKINFIILKEERTIEPSYEETKAIENFPVLNTKKKLQRFSGITSYFRQFVLNCETTAQRLTDLRRQDNNFQIRDDPF